MTPRPGSTGDRALKHLAENGRMSSRALADGIDADSGSMYSGLNLCVVNGLIVREIDDDDGLTYYSLPKAIEPALEQQQLREAVHELVAAAPAEALAPPAADESPPIFRATDFLPKERREGGGIRVVTPREPSSWVAGLVAEQEQETTLTTAITTPAAIDPAAPRRFEVGAFSDGRFVIEVGQESFALTTDEAAKLNDFLTKTVALR